MTAIESEAEITANDLERILQELRGVSDRTFLGGSALSARSKCLSLKWRLHGHELSMGLLPSLYTSTRLQDDKSSHSNQAWRGMFIIPAPRD